ncbi:MAG: carbohydrate kinase family protein, partial [Candidatus Saccharimonas sp.]
YIAHIIERGHSVMRRLGLDPSDTTALELYKALNAHVDDRELLRDTDDVGLVFAGRVISFNRDDIKENIERTFELRTMRHLACRVETSLIERYHAASSLEPEHIASELAAAGLNSCALGEYHAKPVTAEVSTDTPYVLCVGDIFTDVFIKLLEDEARVDTDKDGSKRLSLPFGSKPPYERADIVTSVGPSPNAAVSMARLGLRVGLMSWLGDDQVGRQSLNYLATEHIDTVPVQVQKQTPSNTYYVLRYGADRTILVKNETYEYTWKPPAQPPQWIYLSLISADSWNLHQSLLDYLDANPEVKLAFQPGTFHFKWGAKKLERLYKRAEIVVMNREEAVDVTGAPYDVPRKLAEALHGMGPSYVIITDGPSGSYAFADDKLLTIPNYPDPAPPVDRTGAGDAFASTIVAALALGESFETALKWAPINSMSVVQELGAQAGLLTKEDIAAYLAKAPENYNVEEYTR